MSSPEPSRSVRTALACAALFVSSSVGTRAATEPPAAAATTMELPAGIDPHAKRVLEAVFRGDLPELQRAYARKPLEFSQPGVGAMLLNIACREGRVEVVAWLLNLGCDANEAHSGQLPLSVAVAWDSATLQERLSRDPAIEAVIASVAQTGRTSLNGEQLQSLGDSGLGKRLADLAFIPTAPEILARKAQVVDLLLAHGADVRATARTALVAQAVRTGFGGALVHRLVEAGADPAAIDPDLRANALHLAAYQGNLSAATALLDRGLRLDSLSFPLPPDFPRLKLEPAGGGNTPLMCAAVRGQTEMVRLLLARGADANQTNRQLYTALHIAAAHPGNAAIISLLLAARARPDAANTEGITPLHLAALRGHVAHVKLLCAAGANLELADSAGFTAYLWAAEKDQAAVLDCLLAQGANRRALTDDRTTALRVAANAGAVQAIEFLLAQGDPVEGFPNDNTTPLQSATASGRVAAVKLLLARGAHPDRAARSRFVHPPLIMTVRGLAAASALQSHAQQSGPLFVTAKNNEDNCVEILRALLDAGATIDLSGHHRDTALHVAAENDFRKIANLLLERGARADLANASGLTALELARKKGRTEIAALIERRDGPAAR